MKISVRKILSYAIDYLIVMFFVSIFTFCASVFHLEQETQDKSYLMVLCAFIMVLYFTTYIPTRTNGQTIGQKIMKIKVVNISGADRTYFQSFIRECAVKISFAPFFILFTAIYYIVHALFKRDLNVELPHDFLLKTKVVSL